MKNSKSRATKKKLNPSKSVVLNDRSLKKIRAEEMPELIRKAKGNVFFSIGGKKHVLTNSERLTLLGMFYEPTGSSRDLTTQEVADLVNVSRPYVVKLIDEGKLKSHKVGTKRRVTETAAIEFRKKMRNEQTSALEELAEETQKLDIKFK